MRSSLYWKGSATTFVCQRITQLISLRKHPMFLSLFGGLILRMAVAPWTEERWDSYIHRLMGAYVFGYGINPLFPDTSCNCPAVLNYSFPPIWLTLILPLFRLWLAITGYSFPASPETLWAAWGSTGNLFEAYRSFVPPNLPLLDLFFKTPVILSDVAIGYLIWLFGGRTARAAKFSLVGWIFNPYVIMVGSVWGEFDSIAALFMLLSVYYLQRDQFFQSGTALALGVATKLFPAIIFLPTVSYLLFTKRPGLSKYVSSFIITIAITFSSLLIFPRSLDYLSALLIGRSSPNYGGTPLFSGLTWMLIFNRYSIPFSTPVFFIVLPVLLVLLIIIFRKSLKTPGVLLPFLTSAFLGVYLSYPIINAQYPIWVLPMIVVLLVSRAVSKWAMVLLSVIPLSFLLTNFNPLYHISPALIFDENNFPPVSDVIQQLWHFPPQLNVVLASLFTVAVVLTIYDLLQKSGLFERPTSNVQDQGNP